MEIKIINFKVADRMSVMQAEVGCRKACQQAANVHPWASRHASHPVSRWVQCRMILYCTDLINIRYNFKMSRVYELQKYY